MADALADDDQVALFADLTGCPPEQAQFFLQSAGGNLELAVNEFFLSQEEGAGPMDEGSDGEDEGEDGYEDAEMNMPPLLPVSPSAPAGIPPPSKRPKVEMRQARWLPCSLATPLPPSDAACVWQAPSLPGASAEQLVLLQQVFGLAAKPKDAADTSVLKAPLAPHRSPPLLPPGAGTAGSGSALRILKERQCHSEPKARSEARAPTADAEPLRPIISVHLSLSLTLTLTVPKALALTPSIA